MMKPIKENDMEYKDIQPFLDEHYHEDIQIDFNEYQCISYNIPTLILELKEYDVISYIKANDIITMEEVYKYYGEDALINYESYLIYPYIRLIISKPLELGENETDRILHVLHLNEVFFTCGYQDINLYTKSNTVERNKPLSWLNQL